MTPPKVSLIIATYNRGAQIAPTLDSVLGQTMPADEIIVVDDCSPDNTGQWVQEHYPQVRVVRPEKNGGTSASRNFGAKHAQHERLMFLDHDDELLPDAIQTLTGLLNDFPEAKAAYCDHTYINKVNGTFYPNHHETISSFHRLKSITPLRCTPHGRLYGAELYELLLSGNLLQQPWMIERDSFQKLGGFASDIRYCEDWELYMRVTDAYPIVLSDQVISNHIIEGENLHLDPRQDAMHMEVIRRAMTRERFRSPRRVWKLSRRLAQYHKSQADRAASTQPAESWRANLKAFWYWPFDYVVAIRALLLGPIGGVKRLLLGAKPTA
jgi:glycosyltransferase involved in cell wall biosynthesis